jgi:hypothetical protein
LKAPLPLTISNSAKPTIIIRSEELRPKSEIPEEEDDSPIQIQENHWQFSGSDLDRTSHDECCQHNCLAYSETPSQQPGPRSFAISTRSLTHFFSLSLLFFQVRMVPLESLIPITSCSRSWRTVRSRSSTRASG